MKVLVTVKRSPAHSYLIHLFTKNLIREIRKLIDNKNHHRACVFALTRGVVVREVLRDEIHKVHADLILSENNARWDLVKSQ
ncbi:MAG: hypothetical protein V1927_06145 [Candidatus Omnitrophota bacterium]